MKEWYLVRDGSDSINHKGKNILPKTKILLTVEQAQLHNKNDRAVVKTEPPKTILDAAFPEEYDQWFQTVKPSETPKVKPKNDNTDK